LAAALSAMVGTLTTGKKGYEEEWAAQGEMAVAAQALKRAFLHDIDADTAAFDGIMAAMALPKRSEADKHARDLAMRQATVEAIEVPLRVLERCAATLDCVEVALRGNKNARSDAGVAGLVTRACAEGAFYNVLINLDGFEDRAYTERTVRRARAALGSVQQRAEAIATGVRAELSASLP
jgi:glutamate formiminotransferase/formiminotetrahydrofolate cyclodeaminase